MKTIPKITDQNCIDALAALQEGGFYSIAELCNKAIEIALAEQQESEYITAEQARELGAGNAEYTIEDFGVWHKCLSNCDYLDKTAIAGRVIKYRAIKQAQPEPVDPHAALRAEYAKQVAEGTTGFYLWEYLWEFQNTLGGSWQKTEAPNIPAFYAERQYRYTDISCMVSKDGEPAKRMLRTAAQELQRQTKDTHDWFTTKFGRVENWDLDFNGQGTYTYAPKALKQPAWTGSREDVIALLLEVRLLKEGAV